MSSMLPLRILNLEDEPNDAELTKTALAAEGTPCDLTRVDTQRLTSPNALRAVSSTSSWQTIPSRRLTALLH
jgi:hypothetical protein